MKKCRVCQEALSKDKFVKNKAFKNGVDTICLACNRKKNKQWRVENPDKRKEQLRREVRSDWYRENSLKRNYGITLKDYNEMLEEQEGRCAICNQPETLVRHGIINFLSVDHDHTTGKVRGLLCHSCNLGIGYLKENTATLEAAVKYILSHKTGY